MSRKLLGLAAAFVAGAVLGWAYVAWSYVLDAISDDLDQEDL